MSGPAHLRGRAEREPVTTSQLLRDMFFKEFGYAPTSTNVGDLMNELVDARILRDRNQSRVGIAYVGEHELLQYFGVPAGYEVVGVHASFERRGVEIMLRSPELPPVSPGSQAPLLSGSWDCQTHICYDEGGLVRHAHAERVWRSADVNLDAHQEQDQQDHQDGDEEVQPAGPRAHADHLRAQGAQPAPVPDTDHTSGP